MTTAHGLRRKRAAASEANTKAPTGVIGLDEALRGGLPRGRTSIVFGGPGCGKTIFALQSLVNGARRFNEPGIFVAFEEESRQIVANAASFGWNLPSLQMTGMDLHDKATEIDMDQASRFVFVTGGAFTPRARTFLDSNGNHRIEKPFDVQGLKAIVNGLIR